MDWKTKGTKGKRKTNKGITEKQVGTTKEKQPLYSEYLWSENTTTEEIIGKLISFYIQFIRWHEDSI